MMICMVIAVISSRGNAYYTHASKYIHNEYNNRFCVANETYAGHL